MGLRNFSPLTLPNIFYLFLALISTQLRYMIYVFAHQITLSPVERNIYSMLFSNFRAELRNCSTGKIDSSWGRSALSYSPGCKEKRMCERLP